MVDISPLPAAPAVAPGAPPLEPIKDSGSQAWVAFAIVICVTLIACGCIGASILLGSIAGQAFVIVGTIAGGLLTALQAPSGIGSVITRALKKPADLQP